MMTLTASHVHVLTAMLGTNATHSLVKATVSQTHVNSGTARLKWIPTRVSAILAILAQNAERLSMSVIHSLAFTVAVRIGPTPTSVSVTKATQAHTASVRSMNAAWIHA